MCKPEHTVGQTPALQTGSLQELAHPSVLQYASVHRLQGLRDKPLHKEVQGLQSILTGLIFTVFTKSQVSEVPALQHQYPSH